MPQVFYTGKVSTMMKPVLFWNCCLAWMAGNARNSKKSKDGMRMAYNCEFTEHLSNYDELTGSHYVKVASELLGEIDLRGKSVLDVGCGTGIPSKIAMESGASRITCTDQSPYMLEKADLRDVRTRSQIWKEKFDSPEDAMNYILTTSGSFALATIPPSKRGVFLEALEHQWTHNAVRDVTNDVVYAYGLK